ncbi:polysaccharide biosynthesis/export family protein [Soonwooa sp.]|uniref:polysaccharide biosynthesis/export family protein n=1 Tax=Soonwooa sp. TaxID=1938592 RepID=UPI0026350AF9|nr:polysaccharide biosynthesis/export family protein [Soonwooa sp.]
MNRKIKVLLLCGLIGLTSCKTKEKPSEINYMQNIEQVATDISNKMQVNTIQKGDYLNIFVSAKDMKVVKMFNQNYFSGEVVQSSVSGTTSSTAPTYIVDANGEIDFPVLGKINVLDKTLLQLQDEIKRSISAYVINPSVTIKITNYKVVVLGEVNKPGQYIIPEGQSTLLNALGLAGDVTIYAKRNDILVVRNENGIITKERINLMDANFINSPYFQLKQNDVIYVSSNQTKEKIAKQDPNTGIYMAVAGMVIGLAGIFITIFKK